MRGWRAYARKLAFPAARSHGRLLSSSCAAFQRAWGTPGVDGKVAGASAGLPSGAHGKLSTSPAGDADSTAASSRKALVQGVLGFDSARTQQLARAIAGEAALPMASVGSPTAFLRGAPPAEGGGRSQTQKQRQQRRGWPSPHPSPHTAEPRHPVAKLARALAAACEGAEHSDSGARQTALCRLQSAVTSLASAGITSQEQALQAVAARLSRLLPLDPRRATVEQLVDTLVQQPLLGEAALALALSHVCERVPPSEESPGLIPELVTAMCDFLRASRGSGEAVTTPVKEEEEEDGTCAVCVAAWHAQICGSLLQLWRSERFAKGSVKWDTAQLHAALQYACARLHVAVQRVAHASFAADRSASQASLDRRLSIAIRLCQSLLRTRPLGSSHSTTFRPAELRDSTVETCAHSLMASHLTLLCSCLTEVVRAPTSPSTPVSGMLTKMNDAAAAMEQLWLAWLQPSIDAGRTTDAHTLNHRTNHTALNADLVFLQRDQARVVKWSRSSGSDDSRSLREMDPFYQFWLQHPEAAEVVLPAASSLLEACQARATASAEHSELVGRREWVVACALLVRTLLGLEAKLTFAASRALGMTWSVPTRLSSVTLAPEQAAPLAEVYAKAALVRSEPQRQRWVALLDACDGLRSGGSETVHVLFFSLVQQEFGSAAADATATQSEQTGSVGARPRARLSRLLLAMVTNAYFAVARRHYLCTQGLVRGDVSRHRRVLVPFASTFLLARSAVATDSRLAVQRSADAGVAGVPSGERRCSLQACGTTLAQALEVAFFLTRLQDLSGAAGGEGAQMATPLSPADVEAYVSEALHSLGENTAKQLWHLRSTGTLQEFTGQQADGSLVAREHVRRRHVQATLSVVHAHVQHPSLLWMPLWQLQELVYLFERHRGLFYVEGKASSEVEENAGRREHDMSDATDGSHTHVRPHSDYPPAARYRRATQLSEDGVVVDLMRMHGYLVLRLYVVSNVLRGYRDAVLARVERRAGERTRDANPCTTGEAAAAALGGRDDLATTLRRLEEREPAVEREKRRGSRTWAQEIAEALVEEFPALPADAEGIVDPFAETRGVVGHDARAPHASPRAVVRVLQRLEATVSRALASHLFINVIDDHKRRGREVGRARGSITTADPAAGEVETGSRGTQEVTLTLSRASSDVPLGFVLDASSAAITRVVAAGAGGSADTPFTSAVRALPGASIPAAHYTGWRVVRVNGRSLDSGKLVAVELRGKLEATLTLAPP